MTIPDRLRTSAAALFFAALTAAAPLPAIADDANSAYISHTPCVIEPLGCKTTVTYAPNEGQTAQGAATAACADLGYGAGDPKSAASNPDGTRAEATVLCTSPTS